MDRVHLEVSEFLRREEVGRTRPLLLAVSGGGDSLAMLHVLAAMGQRIAVAHIHHGLRGSAADADLEWVREQALGLGVRFLSAAVDASRADGRSPEARARGLRYEALERLRMELGFEFIATAHTLDDQAETLLLRAIRGTSPAGLASIAPRAVSEAGAPVLRPLLEVRRSALRAYLLARDVSWREDAGNLDPRVPRSRVRQEVLPILEQVHPGATERLAALARLAREDEAWLSREVAEALADASSDAGDGLGEVRVQIGALNGLVRPVRLRALAQILRRAGLAERVTSVHLDRLDRFIRGARPGRSLSLPGAHVALRDAGALVIRSLQTPSAMHRRGIER